MNKRIVAVLMAVCVATAGVSGCSEDICDEPGEIFTNLSQKTGQTATETHSKTQIATTTTTTTATTTATTPTTTTTTTTTTRPPTTTTATAKSSAAKKTTAETKKTTTAAKQTTAATKQTTAVSRISGSSANVAFYKQYLFVMGDSVASGYAAYGRIPAEHSVAKVNVSARSADYQVPLAKSANPPLILTSMGMNDWGVSTSTFIASYTTFLKNLRAQLPDSVILVGAITPTAVVNKYPHISPRVVQSHNIGLKGLVKSFNDPKMIYFDAYSVVVSSDGTYMQPQYAAADGLHLQPAAYDALLKAMAVVLDQNDAKEKIIAHK